jgi:hypothetical protein
MALRTKTTGGCEDQVAKTKRGHPRRATRIRDLCFLVREVRRGSGTNCIEIDQLLLFYIFGCRSLYQDAKLSN